MAGRRAIGGMALAIIIVLVVAVIAAAILLSLPSTSSTPGGSGKMAIMATDPYSSAGGTKQYEHYNNVAAHRSNSGGQPTTQSSSGAGWVSLNASGWLELDSLVNASQTVVLRDVTPGTYDSVRFYVDSAIVTYNGQNHTAQTASSQVTANLNGNAQVSGGSTTAILFDLRTIIINTGSSSNTNFVVTSSGRAEVVPSGSVSSASLQAGARTDLSTSSWFLTFASGSAHLVVTAAAISSNSLSVTVKDTGSESSNVSIITATPISVVGSGQVIIPGSLDGSAVFAAGSGGSLQVTNNILAQVSSGSSVAVSSSSSSTLTYSGTIQFGVGVQALTGVQTGQSYLITVIGNNSATSTTVVAS